MPNHDDVAHAWANKTGKHKKGYNVFYEETSRGSTIYSHGYHFPIARHTHLEGKEVIFLTTRGYSVSTTDHISKVTSAISHLKVIKMDNVAAETKADHRENYSKLFEDRMENLDKASRARTLTDFWLEQAERQRLKINEYTKLFRLGFHPIRAVSEDNIDGAIYRHNEAKRALKKKYARVQEAARRERLERAQKHMKEWQHGERQECPYIEGLHDQVRIKGEVVETSKRVRVKLKDGMKLFRMMAICAKRNEMWIPDTEMKIEDFKVTSIDCEGTLRVACHTITLKAAQIALDIAKVEA